MPQSKRWILAAVALIVVVAGAAAVAWAFSGDVSPQALAARIAGLGDWAVAGFIVLYALATVAMVNLGNLYMTGRGVPQSDAQAAAWYRKAAELGDPGGRRALGYMYLEGRGVPQNLTEASRWLRLVAQPQFTVPKEGYIAPPQ